MQHDRRTLLALGLALPLAAAAGGQVPAPVDTALLWRTLFAGDPGETFAWWYQGTLFAHVDRLREFPVAGFHAIMIARTTAIATGLAIDTRTIGHFSDLDRGTPTARWDNVFTERMQVIPAFFAEGPARYVQSRDGSLALVADNVRTNRIVTLAEMAAGRAMLTQIEGTLQGFPMLAGTLPPLTSETITERQTRLQIIARRPSALGTMPTTGTRGFFTHVYDALPPWLGFGESLGNGLVKGQMRKARAGEILDLVTWRYLQRHVPLAFAGERLVLR